MNEMNYDNIYNEEIRSIYWNRKRIELLKKIRKICEMKIRYIDSVTGGELKK